MLDTPDIRYVNYINLHTQTIPSSQGELCVVSCQGLVNLKRLRGSGQDHDDINRLEGGGS